MIEKNVILFVRGEQQFDQGEPEVTELMTEGSMTLEEDGEITLTYQETELTGMEGHHHPLLHPGRYGGPGPHRHGQLPAGVSAGQTEQLPL